MRFRQFNKLLLLLVTVPLLLARAPFTFSEGPGFVHTVTVKQLKTKTGTLTAPAGTSFLILYWQEESSARHSGGTVSLAAPTERGIFWQELGRGVLVSEPAGEFEEEFAGYYRYPSVLGKEAAVPDFQDYAFRVGTQAGFTEVRVFPPGQAVHNVLQEGEESCIYCHRGVPRGDGAAPLNEELIIDLCLQCHNGRNSKYNVVDGKVHIGGGVWVDSPAGPFSSGNFSSTSYHNVFLKRGPGLRENDAGYRELYAPGGSTERLTLTCTDCHNPHGAAQGSYRMLKYGSAPVEAYSYRQGGRYRVSYINGMNDFCAGCHEYYNYGDGSFSGYTRHDRAGIEKSGSYFRHPTNINVDDFGDPSGRMVTLPLEMRDGGRYITCQTCHFAHGTVVKGVQASAESNKLSTMLKKRPGMGICLECHLAQIWWNSPAWWER